MNYYYEQSIKYIKLKVIIKIIIMKIDQNLEKKSVL